MSRLLMVIAALLLTNVARAEVPFSQAFSSAWPVWATTLPPEAAGMTTALTRAAAVGGWGATNSDTIRENLERIYPPLVPADRRAEPQAPDGQPRVPAGCDGSESCGACYQGAMERLNRNRTVLERLRGIHAKTKKDTELKISVGDGASAIHGVSALAWQKEKVLILKDLNKFYQSYDRKYLELIGYLRESLMAVDACEASEFDNPDWYNRFGFIYYQFMADRYKR